MHSVIDFNNGIKDINFKGLLMKSSVVELIKFGTISLDEKGRLLFHDFEIAVRTEKDEELSEELVSIALLEIVIRKLERALDLRKEESKEFLSGAEINDEMEILLKEKSIH